MQEGTIRKPNDIRRAIGVRLTILARCLRKDFDSQVGEFTLTRSQWSLITTVAAVPGSTQRCIAEGLEMSEASAGRLIDRMVADGLLERREREDDRRARAVYVTAKADPLLKWVEEFAKSREERMFHGMSDSQLETLRELLSIVYNNFNPDKKIP